MGVHEAQAAGSGLLSRRLDDRLTGPHEAAAECGDRATTGTGLKEKSAPTGVSHIVIESISNHHER
jgi:hypothetical protein